MDEADLDLLDLLKSFLRATDKPHLAEVVQKALIEIGNLKAQIVIRDSTILGLEVKISDLTHKVSDLEEESQQQRWEHMDMLDRLEG